MYFQAPDVTTTIAAVNATGTNAERTENLVYVRLIRKWSQFTFFPRLYLAIIGTLTYRNESIKGLIIITNTKYFTNGNADGHLDD